MKIRAAPSLTSRRRTSYLCWSTTRHCCRTSAPCSAEINSADRCYAVGKVYDVEDERYGCLTVLSEDVVNVIGPDHLQETHEDINYTLLCAYLEYRRFCQEVKTIYDAWDDYLEYVMQNSFVTLYKNGVRARLIHTDAVGQASLPTIAFIIYQKYDEIYG